MKHFIIEGGDRLGKSTLIKHIAELYDYDNVSVRHFGKPPKKLAEDEEFLSYQIKCFYKEGYLLEYIKNLENDIYGYYENIVIWNRSHLGEYVYGQMFRNNVPRNILNSLKTFEEKFILYNEDTYLILLTADPDFFLKKEDGNSFSKNLIQKTTELKLFKEVFEHSEISNKLIIKVDENGEFISEEEIFNKVIELIKKS